MHIKFPLQREMLAAEIAFAIGSYVILAMASATVVILAQSTFFGNLPISILERKGPPPGLTRIPTCEDIASEVHFCKKEKSRLMVPMKNPRALKRLETRGCVIRGSFKEGRAIECPKGLAIAGARHERMFRAQDLFSNEQIHATVLHSQGIRGSGVPVAVLDAGVETTHPEIDGAVIARGNFTDNPWGDWIGHGTHVAGIVLGRGRNALQEGDKENRVLGVAPSASLLVGKVCTDDGWCPESGIFAGIEWAVSQGARVINLSLGGGMFLDHCDNDPLAQKINWAADQGVFVVAAAGNSGDSGEGVAVPACASKALAVGSVDAGDMRSSWSQYGKALDVVAPGESILSSYSCLAADTCPDATYVKMSGTSMAAPHAAGAAAILLQENPALTPADLHALFTESADDLGASGFDLMTGFGRLNVEAALRVLRDRDGDGFPFNEDCNDTDASVHPGTQETCNGVDENCDGVIDDGFDGDGDGVTTCAGDCNDLDAGVYPGSDEFCNGKDDNCNGETDEFCPAQVIEEEEEAAPGEMEEAAPEEEEEEEAREKDRESESERQAFLRVQVMISLAEQAIIRAEIAFGSRGIGGSVEADLRARLSHANRLLEEARALFADGHSVDAWERAREAKLIAERVLEEIYEEAEWQPMPVPEPVPVTPSRPAPTHPAEPVGEQREERRMEEMPQQHRAPERAREVTPERKEEESKKGGDGIRKFFRDLFNFAQ